MRLIIFTICIFVHSQTLLQPLSCRANEQNDSVKTISRAIKYKFRDSSYIDQVFSHSGITPHNQVPFGRLEFLGDKVLGLVLSARLYTTFPDQSEGWLTQKLSTLVSNENNARVADQLRLLTYCKINPSHKATGEGLQKIKADTCEALIGAIYKDGGQASAEKFIYEHWTITSNSGVRIQPTVSVASVTPTAALPIVSRSLVENDAAKQLDVYRKNYDLPVHRYVWLNKEFPFQVQLYYGDQAFTEVIQAESKSEAKKQAASRVLNKLQGGNFAEQCKGKSSAIILSLLHKQALTDVGQQLKSKGDPVTSNTNKAPVASNGVHVSSSIVKATATSKPQSSFPPIISYKQAKEHLQDFCQSLQGGLPTYTLVSQPIPNMKVATVTINKFGTHTATGEKAQKLVAKEMYYKITGKEISTKKAKEALLSVCQDKLYGAPQYTTLKGEFKVRVNLGNLVEEAVSNKSQDHAEKLAAKKIYEILRKRHQ